MNVLIWVKMLTSAKQGLIVMTYLWNNAITHDTKPQWLQLNDDDAHDATAIMKATKNASTRMVTMKKSYNNSKKELKSSK